MKCKCTQLKVRIQGHRTDKYFKDFEEIPRDVSPYGYLLKCPNCAQHWVVDFFDKYQHLHAIKVDSPDSANEDYYFKIHKKTLKESSGGYSDKNCIVAGCNNFALNQLMYCADCAINKYHLLETTAVNKSLETASIFKKIFRKVFK